MPPGKEKPGTVSGLLQMQVASRELLEVDGLRSAWHGDPGRPDLFVNGDRVRVVRAGFVLRQSRRLEVALVEGAFAHPRARNGWRSAADARAGQCRLRCGWVCEGLTRG